MGIYLRCNFICMNRLTNEMTFKYAWYVCMCIRRAIIYIWIVNVIYTIYRNDLKNSDRQIKSQIRLLLISVFKVDENAMIRSRYNRIPLPSPDTIRERNKNQDNIKRKAKWSACLSVCLHLLDALLCDKTRQFKFENIKACFKVSKF